MSNYKTKCPRCGRNATEIIKRYENGSIVYQCNNKYCYKTFVVNPFFFKLTKSAEVLAEKLVYQYVHLENNGVLHYWVNTWKSTILEGCTFATRTEALDATVAKLKEVCDE